MSCDEGACLSFLHGWGGRGGEGVVTCHERQSSGGLTLPLWLSYTAWSVGPCTLPE